MNLNDLLLKSGIAQHDVVVFRHRPNEPTLREILPRLAADRSELFNAYQQSHGERVEKALLSANYVVSFIGHEPGRALFVGLYKILGAKPLTFDQFWQVPANIDLKKLGMKGFTGTERQSCLWFDLELTDLYSEWKGKLIVNWPPPERSWWRRAHRNVMPIHAILEDEALDVDMRKWDELNLSWSQLDFLPKRLQSKLAEWRGIYYIFDTSVGKGYVGSASGSENMLGRWRDYAKTGHGSNHLLKNRDPQHFRFTILELVAQNSEADIVSKREVLWKKRLHTRQPLGLNDN